MRKQNKTKKKIIIGSFLFVFILSMTGVVFAEKSPEAISIATSSGASSGYIYGVQISKFAKEDLGLKVIVSEAGSSGAQLKLIESGDCEIATAVAYLTAGGAWKSQSIYAGKPRLPIRTLMSSATMSTLILSRKSANIKSFPDLKGKTFMAKNPGNVTYSDFIGYLVEYHGMKLDDLNLVSHARSSEVSQALQAGSVDAGLRASGSGGSSSIKQLARVTDIDIVSFSEEEIKFLIKKEPNYSEMIIPADTFKGVGKVRNVGYPQYVMCHEDLDEKFVYSIMKVLLDSCGLDTTGRFLEGNPDRNYTLRSSCPSTFTVPYHAGAVKYFKDRGVWTDKHEETQKSLF